MSGVTVKVRDDGSYRVEGPVTLLDGEGNAFPLQAGERVVLCRCRHSEDEAVVRRVGPTGRLQQPGPCAGA